MKERSILFSAPMVRALLAGTKTVTRRVIKFPVLGPSDGSKRRVYGPGDPALAKFSPFGNAGDRLWVRETLFRASDDCWFYKADHAPVTIDSDDPRVCAMVGWAHHKKSDTCVSIHMPRFAARITLEVTSARVERLQDITEEQAKAEGVTADPQQGTMNGKPATLYPITHRQAFIWLWDSINGKRAPWASNPWVFAVEFQRVKP